MKFDIIRKMSTKSLDLSLPLSNRQQFSNNIELSSLQLTKEHLKTKLDFSKIQCYEELGAKLIEDRLLLTALELYAELVSTHLFKTYLVQHVKSFLPN
jgi:hypothetical protein